MGHITDKPSGLAPTPNDLDQLPDDLLGPHPAAVRLGNTNLFTMDNPPLPGQTMKVELSLYHKRGGYELVGAAPNKEMSYYCGMVLVGHNITVQPYTAATEQDPGPEPDPAMLNEKGQIPDDEPEDEPLTESGRPDGLDEFDPQFSHNGE